MIGVCGASAGGGCGSGEGRWGGEGFCAEHGEFGGGDFSASLVRVTAAVHDGFWRRLRCGGCFVEDGDEDLWRLIFPDLGCFFGKHLQLRFMFGFVSAVVEVEGSGGELVDGGMLFQQGVLLGGTRFGDGAVSGAERFAEVLRLFLQLPFQDFADELVLFDLPSCFDVLCTLFDFSGFCPFSVGHQGEESSGRGPPRDGVEAWFEDGPERVIIRLQDGIMFVVVALSASEGEAEESAGDDLEGL